MLPYRGCLLEGGARGLLLWICIHPISESNWHFQRASRQDMQERTTRQPMQAIPLSYWGINLCSNMSAESSSLSLPGGRNEATELVVFTFIAYLSVAPAILQKCVGGFLLYKFWRIFAGIFLEDFSRHFFPQK